MCALKKQARGESPRKVLIDPNVLYLIAGKGSPGGRAS